MNYQEIYQSKKCSPEAAISFIKSGDRVLAGGNPAVLFKALYDCRDNYKDVEMYAQFSMVGRSRDYIHNADMVGHVSFATTTLSPPSSVTTSWPQDNLDQMSLSFSGLERLIETRIQPAVAIFPGCPMDDEGFINLGCNHGCVRTAIDMGAKVVVQINEELLNANTDYYRVHISEVDVLIEAKNPPEERMMMVRDYGEKEEKLAAAIVERIPNGATIQLGAGGVSTAVGLYLKDHKDLGVHAETILETLIPLMESGVINNSRKPLLRGISVAGFVNGGARTLQHIHNNPNVIIKKLAWVNDSLIISQIPNMVSVNACLAVDLRGQVCSESLGMGFTGGIGGQLDFVEGARKSPNGQSYLAMHSSVKPKSSDHKISKITLTLPRGSVVTTPASEVMNIVTEYGVAELYCKSVKERTQNLIRVADPEFRESLTYEAKKAGLL